MKPPDPNEYNPFEPPETHEQRARRVGEIIRENVDRKMGKPEMYRQPTMTMPRVDTAYRLAQEIIRLRMYFARFHHGLTYRPEGEWERAVLKACEDAIGYQDRVIEEYRRLIVDCENVRVQPQLIFSEGELP